MEPLIISFDGMSEFCFGVIQSFKSLLINHL